MKWVRYDETTETHSTLRLRSDGWRLEVRRASALVANKAVTDSTAYNCIRWYGFVQVD